MSIHAVPVPKGSHLYKQVKALYHQGFPPVERMPAFLFDQLIRLGRGKWVAYMDGNQLVGFTFLIYHKDLLYIHYFATDEAFHGQGYGSKILDHLKVVHPHKRLFLYIEAPWQPGAYNPGQRHKRLAFYLRNDLTPAGVSYEERGHCYDLLSYRCQITKAEAAAVLTMLTTIPLPSYFLPHVFDSPSL
ncbi:GNAT family N-acetyltransferase [Eubacterium barkeri]|uniref:Acetyltransferase (GNAT) domain-containing protein n=1 Tax=Eubacterium barkeri TaxID=1528 RepID=A0A1H3BMU9_EUBBA|nr:GNAT family N-acetyltransferase [Eubacterium barkeri]SDX43312.1 Acetyltransferase (GNAT) domain-containing protein [Eubacterium barkeri]